MLSLMERKQIGLLSIIIGVILFILGLFVLLPIEDFYLLSLFILFIACVLIALGSALIKGIDVSLETPSGDCYYCKGTGMIKGLEGEGAETCPRCGGTGLARADD